MYGFARTKMTDEEFRDLIALTLTCRIDKEYVFLGYKSPVTPVGRELLVGLDDGLLSHAGRIVQQFVLVVHSV